MGGGLEGSLQAKATLADSARGSLAALEAELKEAKDKVGSMEKETRMLYTFQRESVRSLREKDMKLRRTQVLEETIEKNAVKHTKDVQACEKRQRARVGRLE